MNDSTLYEITETRYQPVKERTTLDFSGTLEEAKQNIGVRYAVFRKGGVVAEYQAYYRTTIKCPNCGEVIPLE